MSSPSFAPVSEADIPALLPMMQALQIEDPFDQPFNSDRAIGALKEMLDHPALGRAWLIELDARSIGYVVLTLTLSIELGGRAGMVDELYVVPEHRGQGIGRAALQFVAEQADALGARVLLLEVSRSNERAKQLYRSVGFEDRGYHLMKRTIKST